MATTRKKPTYAIYDGMRVPLTFPESSFKYTREYEPSEGDLLFVGYPKCGNTWIMHIVYALTHDLHEIPEGKKLHTEIPFLEYEGKDCERFPSPRHVKTHMPCDIIKYSPKAKYIYAARNPKDCCVSFYHHTKGFVTDYKFGDGTFDDFFECFMDGELDNNDYFDHLLSFWPHHDDPNFLLLTYEQMKLDTPAGIVRIGEFLGGDAAELVKHKQNIDKVLQITDFNKMKENPSKFQYDDENFTTFFRKGIVGDWKNYFSAEQERRLLEKFHEKFQGTDIPKLWEKFPGIL